MVCKLVQSSPHKNAQMNVALNMGYQCSVWVEQIRLNAVELTDVNVGVLEIQHQRHVS